MTDATARSDDPDSSHEAADRVAASHLERKVYQFLHQHRPRQFTTLQIAARMGIDKWSVSPRMKPLHRKGYLKDPVTKAGLNSNGKIRNLQHWSAKDKA